MTTLLTLWPKTRSDHCKMDSGHFKDALTPYAGGIYGYGCVILCRISGAYVKGADTPDLSALDYEISDRGISEHYRAVKNGVLNVGVAEAERVYGSVRNIYCAQELRIDRRLVPEGICRAQDAGFYARFFAGLDELFLVIQAVAGIFILGESDKQPACIFYAACGNGTEDPVLADALAGRFRIFDGVTCSGVEQTVIAARCASGHV